MKSYGIRIIEWERIRQIKEEGYTAQHDYEHTDGELAAAACVYADFANYQGEFELMDGSGKAKVLIPRDFKWPFKKDELKLTPENRLRELQKAGALIAAEIDRLVKSDYHELPKSISDREYDLQEFDKEKLGQIIDGIDSLAHALQIPLSAEIHVEQMKNSLPEKVKELKIFYEELTGENPWE